MTIGSGDTTKLLSGTNTKGFKDLLDTFVTGDRQYYNALASPIDALRTGAILEENYLRTLDGEWYAQHKATCKEFDVLRSSLDFARLNGGEVVEFRELKTIWFDDYLNLTKKTDIKKKFKSNYNQVQFQLLCTGLQRATIVYLAVYCYDDEINELRTIEPHDMIEFTIERDEEVIDKIKERAAYFQHIKDFLNK
jgi:hypothetical protein